MDQIKKLLDYNGKDATRLLDKKLYLFDMDGTIYLDDDLFEGIPELLQNIAKKGARYVFITNNSSKSLQAYVQKLHRLGLTNVNEENFYTSVQASISLLKEKHPNDLIYLQGTKSFVEELYKSGLTVTAEYDEKAKVALLGFDPEFTGEKIYNTCKLLTLFSPVYYATNPDWVCPVEFGYIPDCGSMCESIKRATGKSPYFIGKPQPEMIFAVMKKFNCLKQDTVVIGDRLYTDIASGNNAGVDTVCVLTGEVKYDEVLRASGAHIPTFTFEKATDILK